MLCQPGEGQPWAPSLFSRFLFLGKMASIYNSHSCRWKAMCSWPSGILFYRPGIKPGSCALEGGFLSHWTTREVQEHFLKYHVSVLSSSSHQIQIQATILPSSGLPSVLHFSLDYQHKHFENQILPCVCEGGEAGSGRTETVSLASSLKGRIKLQVQFSFLEGMWPKEAAAVSPNKGCCRD